MMLCENKDGKKIDKSTTYQMQGIDDNYGHR